MKTRSDSSLSRRHFLRLTGLATAAVASGWHLASPSVATGQAKKIPAKLAHFFPTIRQRGRCFFILLATNPHPEEGRNARGRLRRLLPDLTIDASGAMLRSG
jgi:hypothetical protein